MEFSNERVRAAMERLRRDASDEAREDFYREVLRGELLLAVADSDDELDATPDGRTHERDLPALTTASNDGGHALLAFTDVESLRARAVESRIVAIAARDLLALIADGRYDGLVLNPAGRWVGLSRDDIRRILAAAS